MKEKPNTNPLAMNNLNLDELLKQLEIMVEQRVRAAIANAREISPDPGKNPLPGNVSTSSFRNPASSNISRLGQSQLWAEAATAITRAIKRNL